LTAGEPAARLSTLPPAPAGGLLAGIRAWFDIYTTLMRIAIAEQFQYRVANYFYMIGMITEPVVYLVVWTTVATQQGGSVGGFTPGQFAAYYIVWTLVRNMNIVFTPFGWEWRIREGQFSGQLLRPMHPIHNDLGFFAGWKVVVIILWLPIAAILSLLFHPSFEVTPLGVTVFFVAIWGAYLIRSLNQSTLGMVTFWTTRVGPVFDIYFTAELLLSGRLVPMSLMPDWVRSIAAWLPFQWTFGFPIEALVGNLSTAALFGGLAMQLFWITAGAVVLRFAFRFAVKRYSAVGG
jgi:ABC-2 type transport system permease protein